MICPLMSRPSRGQAECHKENCAWFCPDTGVCAVVKIQEELIKLMGE